MKRKIFENREQFGRSMTEMLGVLAIIGVLSIGALLGYSYAISKLRANNLIDELNKYAVLISQQYANPDGIINFNEIPDQTVDGYGLSGDIIEGSDDFFELSIFQVEREVCERILESSWNVPSKIYVNINEADGSKEICGSEEYIARMDFEFSYDLNGTDADSPENKRCETDSDCTDPCGASCVNGKCRSVCDTGTECVKDYDTTKYMCCAVENVLNGFCCTNISDGQCCRKWNGSSKLFCCPPDKPLVDGWGTKCLSCDDPQAGVVYLENARCTAVCPNRVQSGPYCLLESCPPEKPLADWMGNCYPCDYDGYINMWYGGKCLGVCKPETRFANGQYCGLKTD